MRRDLMADPTSDFSLQQAAYESCKPLGSWVADLQQRVDFFTKWSDQILAARERREKGAQGVQGAPGPMELEDMENDREQPRSFWLPGFFFPQGEHTLLLLTEIRHA